MLQRYGQHAVETRNLKFTKVCPNMVDPQRYRYTIVKNNISNISQKFKSCLTGHLNLFT